MIEKIERWCEEHPGLIFSIVAILMVVEVNLWP